VEFSHVNTDLIPNKPTSVGEDSCYRSVSEAEWNSELEAHLLRYANLVEPHTERRSRHIKDPITDFLFEYYAFRPSHLKRFSPGLGVVLEGDTAEQFLGRPEFARVTGGVALVPSAGNVKGKVDVFESGSRWILHLLRATQDRKPRFSCFGMHEWAMLYKSDDPRHAQLNLRVSEDELAGVVEEIGVRCSHFDAYRFFTDAAIPLNEKPLTREAMPMCEQPGCLHANMDVYRWAFKRAPWISSRLTMDAFELALEIRQIDMASSPYDLTSAGVEPVRVETREGREIFVRAQQNFADRAALLRTRLIEEYELLLERLVDTNRSFAIPESTS